MTAPLTSDAARRLEPFVARGLVPRVPTPAQLLQGQLEMLLYVILPDATDVERYAGTRLGHPLARTPLLIWEIGFDHLRAGHGLGSTAEGLYKHLNFVYHEGFPTYDLQLIHTVPGGLEDFRRYTREIEEGATPERARQRRRVDLVIPEASGYRRRFLEPGGWIDQAADFAYPTDDEVPAYLRPEFSSLTGFMNHCARAYPERVRDLPLARWPGHLLRLSRARLDDERYASASSSRGRWMKSEIR